MMAGRIDTLAWLSRLAARAGPAARAPALGLCLMLAACGSETVTRPPRSATEQLLISAAVDRAAEELAAVLPVDGTMVLVPVNLDSPDGRYAVAAVRDALLRRGARVVDDRATADHVVELRAGALSMDDASMLIGIPSMSVPLVQGLQTPKIALFSEELNQGVAKLAGTAYDPETGELVASSGPRYGFSHKAEWTALLVVTWSTSDLTVDDWRPEPLPWE